MSILDYKNIDEIQSTLIPVIMAETLSATDKSILQITDIAHAVNLSTQSNIIIELHGYNDDAELSPLFTIQNMYQYLWDRNLKLKTYFQINADYTVVSFDAQEFFKEFYPYFSGRVKLAFNFISNVVSDSTMDNLIVTDISPTRNEARIKYIKKEAFSFGQLLSDNNIFNTDISINDNVFVNFKNDNLFSVLNMLVESDDSLIARFYDPLPLTADIKQVCFICKKVINSNILTADIVGKQDIVVDTSVGLVPNFNIKVGNTNYQGTGTYKTLGDLTGTSSATVILSSFSSSMDTLNVDYSDYKNFVFYSSAVKRLENLKYKIQLYEDYGLDMENYLGAMALLALAGSSSFETSQSLVRVSQALASVQASFTPYEKYVFYESSSYYSGSLGETLNSAWPKTTTVKPHTLCAVDSIESTTWYNGQLASASLYDSMNPNILSKTSPLYIQEDSANNDYITFVNMVGEYFDELRLYVDNITHKNITGYGENSGISSELVSKLISQFGGELITDMDGDKLEKYILGLNDSSLYNLTTEQKKNVLLKRFLSNLVYFLKSKGSYQLFHSFANMLGIDRDYYEIREYGGPDPTVTQFDQTVLSDTVLDYTNLTYSLKFDGSQNVKIAWQNYESSSIASPTVPDSILLKFKLNDVSVVTQSLFESLGRFTLLAIKTPTDSTSGKLMLLISGTVNGNIVSASTSEIPVFNGNFWNVLFQRSVRSNAVGTPQTYSIKANSIVADSINFYVTASKLVTAGDMVNYNRSYSYTSSNFYIGGATGSTFTSVYPLRGNISSFKMYTEVIRDDIFQRHSLAETFQIGNDVTSSAQSLVTYFRFDENKNLSTTSSVYDSNVSSYGKNHGTASGFTSNIYQSRYETNIVNIKTTGFSGRPTSTKIRIDNNYVTHSNGYSYLSTDQSIEESSLTKYGKDLNKVDFVFSPVNMENKQIIMFLNPDITEYMSHPKFMIDEVGAYTDLDAVYRYFRKYNSQVPLQNYIDNAYKLSKTLFKNIHQFSSERTNLNAGISLEPNILERSNVVMIRSVDVSNLTYTASLSNMSPDIVSQYLLYTSSLSLLPVGTPASYILNQTTINLIPAESSSSPYVNYFDNIVLSNITASANNSFKGTGILFGRDDIILTQGVKRRIVTQTTGSVLSFFTCYSATASLYEIGTSSFIRPISDLRETREYTGSIGWYTKRNSAMEPLYDANYNTYYAPNHIRYYIYECAGRLKSYFEGTTTRGPEHPSGATTFNGDQVIEITYISPNIAIIDSQATDKPRLKVEGVDLDL